MAGKKVALLGMDINFDRSTGAGVASYMYELANILKRLGPESGFDVEVRPYRRGSSELADFIGLVLSNATKSYREYDIVHNLDVKPILPLNRGRAEFVATAHDYQPLLAPELDSDMQGSLKSKAKLVLWIRYSLKLTLYADYIIARSTMTKDDAVRLGFDRDRIFVVGGAVDKRYRAPLPAKKNRNRFVVGYIGAFRARKNVAFAVRAFNELSDKGIFFDLWGKPAYEYDAIRQAATNPNISFKGFAPEGKLVSIYDSFDAFVFPSLYEGLCLPILEAQARGLPVIICKEGRIPEETRRYCLVAKDEDEMAGIIMRLKNEGYDPKLRKKAMAYARSFTWEKTAKETLEVYEKILS
ncbi:MAG: glycosyltransferase [Candidatus Micrarchaeaceae archaeon]